MKNPTKIVLAIAAASVLASTVTFANEGDPKGNEGQTMVKGYVNEVCELTGFPMMITLPDELKMPAYIHEAGMTATCNNPHGATFTLKREKGRLTNKWDETLSLQYKAELDVAITEFPKVVLKDGATEDSADVDRNMMLAMGVEAGLHITLMEDAKYSGWYKDTLTVGIKGR